MAKSKKSSTKKKTTTRSKAPAKAKKGVKKTTRTAKAGEEVHAATSAEGAQARAPRKVAAPTKRAPLTVGTQFTKNGQLPDTWHLIDATGITLGRLSSHIAHLLMGKAKAAYTRFSDTGDHIVVINAEKVVLTGKKWEGKTYYYHTNYPGGIKSFTARQLLENHPERLIERAVYGMLPKGHMGRHWFKKLRVIVGPEHTHQAQQPKTLTLPDLGTWEKA